MFFKELPYGDLWGVPKKVLLRGNLLSVSVLYTISVTVSDCVHTMPAHFENGEKCDG